MIGYVLRRLLQSAGIIVLISFLLFFGMQLVPGGPMQAFSQNPRMSQITRLAIIHRWGLDQPLYIQYFKWFTSMLTGDWQVSFLGGRQVKELILKALPATLLLMGTAYLIAQLIALPAGIYAALKRYSFFDQFVTFFSYVGFSMPTFFLGLVLLFVFGVFLKVLPTSYIIDVGVAGTSFLSPDYGIYFSHHPIQAILDIAAHLVLPATTIAVVTIAGDSRFMRASMLDAIHQDYMRTARAKGLPERTVVVKHGLRNALLPVITNIGLELPLLFSGAIVTESIFTWPGMGQLFFGALNDFDYPLMMGILFVSAILIVLGNLLADIMYAVVDPRISYA
jgi:peptide/nickel transport system permease protein